LLAQNVFVASEFGLTLEFAASRTKQLPYQTLSFCIQFTRTRDKARGASARNFSTNSIGKHCGVVETIGNGGINRQRQEND